MTRSALVIHSDENQLRFACEALAIFRPGFRVRTAGDLETASDWLNTLTPDLVILEASIAGPGTLKRWALKHNLDPQRTMIFGVGSSKVEKLGSASVREPVKLPAFMSTVRGIVAPARDPAHDPIKQTEPGRR